MSPHRRTRTELIEKVTTDRRRLEQNLSMLLPDEMLQPGIIGDWSVKDILAHLAEWEELFLSWLDAARRGETPEVPGHGSTWRNLDPLNQFIYQKHRDQDLDSVIEEFDSNHAALVACLDGLSEEELFIPGYFYFAGTARLENWVDAFASHDRWAKNHLRKWMKKQGILTPATRDDPQV
jgi:hypothetical protein